MVFDPPGGLGTYDGCVATTTGEEAPGDPQISYKNTIKNAFEPVYVRRNFAPPKSS